MSRADSYPDKTAEASELIKTINHNAVIFSQPWDRLNTDDILSSKRTSSALHTNCYHHGEHDDCCHHNAEETFDTVTIKTDRRYSARELNKLMHIAEHEYPSDILRAKGIVRGKIGYMDVQYVPGNLKINNCIAKGGVLCFIGKNLDRLKLEKLFGGNL